MDDRVRKLAKEDGRYSAEAYRFLLEGLEVAVHLAGKGQLEGPERHITGRDVLRGLEAHGTKLFGPLAPGVWRRWGVRRSIDWGHIVFALVAKGHLSRQESDSLDDFRGGADFDQVFGDYQPSLPTRLGN
ncbi:MAG: hypothetical protein GC161_01135 [Planctomycetaceae bacterium]|nr:hypothetical protein [Planctomycetaceae bacterium]